jgi:hypothetical protein
MRTTMAEGERLAALRAVPRFDACPPGRLEALAEVAEEVVLAPGSVLGRNHHQRPMLGYLILSGTATPAGGVGVGPELGPGTVLGDLSPDPAANALPVTALTLVHLLAMPAPEPWA